MNNFYLLTYSLAFLPPPPPHFTVTPAGTVSQGPGPGRNRVQGQARSGRHDPPGQGRRKPRRSPRAGAANERAAFKSERDKPRPPLILVEGGRGQRHVIIDPVMFSQRELRAWCGCREEEQVLCLC